MIKSSTVALSRAEDLLATMIGEYVWFSRAGQDAILRMDFGSPHLHVREPSPRASAFTGAARSALERRIVVPTGRWHLFVESGFWSINVKALACSRSDAESADATRLARVASSLSQLDGQKLTDVSWTAASRAWQFKFHLEGTVSIEAGISDGGHANSAEADWTVFFEDGSSLSCMPDHTFVLEGMQAGTE